MRRASPSRSGSGSFVSLLPGLNVRSTTLLPRPNRVAACAPAAVVVAAALSLLLLSLRPVPASAQEPEIVVKVGEEPTASVVPGGQISLPVIFDLSEAGGLDLDGGELSVTWDPALASFVSATAGDVGTVTIDESGVADGELSASLTDAGGPAGSFSLLTLTLEAGSTEGGMTISPEVSAATSVTGSDLLPSLSTRAVELCIGVSGLAGDVTDDGTVNIIDAQQIARFSVGLPVPTPALFRRLGDVNRDGATNIIDAQQVARFSVGLPTDAAVEREVGGGCDFLPQPPSAEIVSPEDGASFETGEEIRFEGRGEDPEDGELGGEALAWESNRDGPLGTGEVVNRSDLAPGEHRIVLTATDSDGQVGVDQVEITLERPVELTREEAIACARPELVDPVAEDFFVLGLAPQEVLAPGTEIHEIVAPLLGTTVPKLTVDKPSYFIFVDLVPTAAYAHPVKYALVDANSCAVTETKALYPPSIDGVDRYLTFEARLSSGDRFQPEDLSEPRKPVMSFEFKFEPGALSRSASGDGTLALQGTFAGAEAGKGSAATQAAAGGEKVAVVVAAARDARQVNNADVMADRLRNQGFEVTKFNSRDHTLGDVRQGIRDAAKGLGSEDKFHLYVSGHSLLSTGGDDEIDSPSRRFAYDMGHENEKNWPLFLSSGGNEIPGSLPEMLDDIEAGHVNLVLQTCSAESITHWIESGTGFDPPGGTEVRIFPSSSIKTSSYQGQFGEVKFGAYTKLLLDALSGIDPDTNGDGEIAPAEFEAALVEAHRAARQEDKLAREQTPDVSLFGVPNVEILSPDPGATFKTGEDIPFEGTAEDDSGNFLPSATYVWESSLDGRIGVGIGLVRDDLSVGEHVITLTVTDSDGSTGSASIPITVEATVAAVPEITGVEGTRTSSATPDEVEFEVTGTFTDDVSSLSGEVDPGEAGEPAPLGDFQQDGDTFTATAAVTFTRTGTFTPTVTVESPAGSDSQDSGPIEVTEISVTREGEGTVTALDDGSFFVTEIFTCDPTCRQLFTSSESEGIEPVRVRLEPDAAGGWNFDGWDGDTGGGECPETGNCVVVADVNRSITAFFKPLTGDNEDELATGLFKIPLGLGLVEALESMFFPPLPSSGSSSSRLSAGLQLEEKQFGQLSGKLPVGFSGENGFAVVDLLTGESLLDIMSNPIGSPAFGVIGLTETPPGPDSPATIVLFGETGVGFYNTEGGGINAARQPTAFDAFPAGGNPESGAAVAIQVDFGVRFIDFDEEVNRHAFTRFSEPGLAADEFDGQVISAWMPADGTPGDTPALVLDRDTESGSEQESGVYVAPRDGSPPIRAADVGLDARKIRCVPDGSDAFVCAVTVFGDDELALLTWDGSTADPGLLGTTPVGDGPVDLDLRPLESGDIGVVTTGFNDNTLTVLEIDAGGNVVSSDTRSVPAGCESPAHAIFVRDAVSLKVVGTCTESANYFVMESGM